MSLPLTLRAFQHALSELVASPASCLDVRAGRGEFFGRFDLSQSEKQRLREVVWQQGMSVSCSMYRSNRVTPIYTLLNFTCFLLGDKLKEELEGYWASSELIDLQYKEEIERFGQYLKRRIHDGAIKSQFVEEVLDFELAMNELQFVPRKRPVSYTHLDVYKRQLADEVFGGFWPVRELEGKAGIEQACWNDAAALEYEFGFGAQKECADLDGQSRGGKAVGHAPGLAQGEHEFAVGERVGRGEVDGAVEVFALDEEVDGAAEVGFVNPTNELTPAALRSAEAEADEIEKGFKGVARRGAESDGTAQCDFARVWSPGGEELGLPVFGDTDGEVPCIGRAASTAEQAGGDELVTAEFAPGLVHGLG